MAQNPKSVFARCDRLIVTLSGRHPPEQAEWSAFTKDLVEFGHASAGKSVMLFVVTDGGGPSTIQRTDFLSSLGDLKVRTSVLSASTLVRGMVTVFNWFNVQSKVFAPKDVLAAFDFLEVAPAMRTTAWTTIENLAKQLGGLQTVDSARPLVRKAADNAATG